MLSIGSFRAAMPSICRARVALSRDKLPAPEDDEVCVKIGILIVEQNIDANRLTNQELLAAIFVVDHVAKEELTSVAEAYNRKDELHILLVTTRIRKGLTVRHGSRRFRGTIEIGLWIWATHVPKRLLKKLDEKVVI